MNTFFKKALTLCGISLLSITSFASSKIASDTLKIQTETADTVGPVISAAIHFKRINLKTYQSTQLDSKPVAFPKSSELSITGTDAAGIKELYITLDNAPEIPYKEAIRLTAKGKHSANIRAVDNLGNQTTYSLKFVIKE